MTSAPRTPAAAAAADDFYINAAARTWTSCAPSAAATHFHRSMPGYAASPLTALPGLAAELGVGGVWVKDESVRFGLSAFKVLGAAWGIASAVRTRCLQPERVDETWLALLEVADEEPVQLVAATDGNHGEAVASLATQLGLPSVVMLPAHLPQSARARIRAAGARLLLVDGSYDDAVQGAMWYAAQRPDAVLIQDTSWPGYESVPQAIVDGYTTICREMDDALDVSEADRVLIAVPMGVGSLAQSVVTYFKDPRHRSRNVVLGVEPTAAPSVVTSLRSGKRIAVGTSPTVMAGLECGTASAIALPALRAGLDAAVAVPDEEVLRDVVVLGTYGLDCGPCGAATLSGARATLTGVGSEARRAQLGITNRSIVVLLNTESNRGNRG